MNSPDAGVRLLLLGATGAVGQQVLGLALQDERVAQVIAPTRRPLTPHAKLSNPITNFSALPDDASVWGADAVICALGTTIRKAGSEAAFVAVDRDLPIAIAKRARTAGARSFALNSSLGASLAGNFYLRTKAQVEDGIRQLRFPSYTIVRPSLINARRPNRGRENASAWPWQTCLPRLSRTATGRSAPKPLPARFCVLHWTPRPERGSSSRKPSIAERHSKN